MAELRFAEKVAGMRLVFLLGLSGCSCTLMDLMDHGGGDLLALLRSRGITGTLDEADPSLGLPFLFVLFSLPSRTEGRTHVKKQLFSFSFLTFS